VAVHCCPIYEEEALLLEGSQSSCVCPSDESNGWMKMCMWSIGRMKMTVEN
jgi:hypothetical protein